MHLTRKDIKKRYGNQIMKYGARRIAHISIAVSVAMILSYIEFLLPPVWSAVPGIKLGLANIVIIFALYRYGIGNAALISGLRIFLSALLFGSIMTLLYSAAGVYACSVCARRKNHRKSRVSCDQYRRVRVKVQ